MNFLLEAASFLLFLWLALAVGVKFIDSTSNMKNTELEEVARLYISRNFIETCSLTYEIIELLFRECEEDIHFQFTDWNNNGKYEFHSIPSLCAPWMTSIKEEFIIPASALVSDKEVVTSRISMLFYLCIIFDWSFALGNKSETFRLILWDYTLIYKSVNLNSKVKELILAAKSRFEETCS